MKIYNPLRFKPLKKVFGHIKKRIRLELMLSFLICIIAFYAAVVFSSYLLSLISKSTVYTDYTYENFEVNDVLKTTANYLNTKAHTINASSDIQNIIINNSKNAKVDILLVNANGVVLYKPYSNNTTKVDIYDVINNYVEHQNYQYNINYERYNLAKTFKQKIFYSIYPIKLNGQKYYLLAHYVPRGTTQYYNTPLTSFSMGILTFILLFLFITRKKMQYIEHISQGLIEISKGNLSYKVEKKGEDELALLSQNINYMAAELNSKIDMERRAEKTKNELITNVSHDLKTPLTSILGYLGLVKNEKYESKEQLEDYINITYNKAEKLKLLIEDLFEYTKLSSEGILLNMEAVALNEFLVQLIEELVPIFDENDLTIEKEIPAEKVYVNMDITKSLRLFENLIMNAVKYSYKPGVIKIRLHSSKDNVIICIENKGDNIPKEHLEKLFDRFYRQDKSRTSSTGGSGLGLAIAKSITELQNGKIWAECEENNICFYVSFKITNFNVVSSL